MPSYEYHGETIEYAAVDVGDYVEIVNPGGWNYESQPYDAIVVRAPATHFHILFDDPDEPSGKRSERGAGPVVEVAPVDYAGTVFVPAEFVVPVPELEDLRKAANAAVDAYEAAGYPSAEENPDVNREVERTRLAYLKAIGVK